MRSKLEQEITEVTVIHEMKRLYIQEITAQDESGEYLNDRIIDSIETMLYYYMPLLSASQWIEKTVKLYRNL